MAKIEDLKKQHQGKWLAIVVTRSKDSSPVEGDLVLAHGDKGELIKKVRLEKEKRVYITYVGPLIEEGYSVAFHAV